MRWGRTQRVRGGSTSVSSARWAMLSAALALLGFLVAAHHPRPAQRLEPQRGVERKSPTPSIPSTAHTPEGGSLAPSPDSNVGASLPEVTAPVNSPTPSVFRVPQGAAPLSDTTTTQPTVVTTTVPTVSASATRHTTDVGWLQAPLVISATYPVPSGSVTRVTASWIGTTELTLTSSCAGAVTGPSGIALVVTGIGCQVTISGPPTIPTTSYTMEMST